ncbi:hypothetical protein BSKO_09412 [Bryopsis sp. KO-2023]|nr:hypothetical protein BSKO_09412 [Bryopsis sp. KO-2023]
MEPRVSIGALGPRLAGRLTAELILRSPQYMNCVKNYEIDLRGNKIGAIENLGATNNQFDSIDLSDNAIVLLEGFPKLPRLKVLLLNNNRVTRIGRDLQDCIPKLDMLILTNNKVTHLSALDPLSTLPKLVHLSLMGNPVTKVKDYRLYVIHLIPSLKVLDFRKVKAQERLAANEMFGGVEGSQNRAEASKTFQPDEDAEMAEARVTEAASTSPSSKPAAPTAEQLTAIKAAIANAQTLEEVRSLESALKQGMMPSQLEDPGKGGEKEESQTAENGSSKEGGDPGEGDAMEED